MTQTVLTAGGSASNLAISNGNDGTLVLQTGDVTKVNALSFAPNGAISLIGQTVSASTTNTVTNKVAISINGVTYYLLASTSGT